MQPDYNYTSLYGGVLRSRLKRSLVDSKLLRISRTIIDCNKTEDERKVTCYFVMTCPLLHQTVDEANALSNLCIFWETIGQQIAKPQRSTSEEKEKDIFLPAVIHHTQQLNNSSLMSE